MLLGGKGNGGEASELGTMGKKRMIKRWRRWKRKILVAKRWLRGKRLARVMGEEKEEAEKQVNEEEKKRLI